MNKISIQSIMVSLILAFSFNALALVTTKTAEPSNAAETEIFDSSQEVFTALEELGNNDQAFIDCKELKKVRRTLWKLWHEWTPAEREAYRNLPNRKYLMSTPTYCKMGGPSQLLATAKGAR